MVGCAVKKCTNNKKNKPVGVTFHTFPLNPIMRERWRMIIAKERKDEHYKPSACSVVCSEHFKQCDTYLSKKGFRQIKKFAIPHIIIQSEYRNSVNDYSIETVLTMSEESCTNLSQVDAAFQSNQILNSDSGSAVIESKDVIDTHDANNFMLETFNEENFCSVSQFHPENTSPASLIKHKRNDSHKKKGSDYEMSDPPIFADYEAEVKKFKRKLSFKDKQIRNLRQQNRRLKEANDTMKQLLRDVRKIFD